MMHKTTAHFNQGETVIAVRCETDNELNELRKFLNINESREA